MPVIMNTEALVGTHLLEAVKQALIKSYTDLSFKVGELGLPELQAYLEANPAIDLGHGFDDNSDDIRAAILAHHEQLLPGDSDFREACDEDLWPLCERILENYGYTVGRRVKLDGRVSKLVWRVEVESEMFRIYGDTPREGILRCYVKDKLGDQVTFDI